jgi:CheY-like chemotaxis protein
MGEDTPPRIILGTTTPAAESAPAESDDAGSERLPSGSGATILVVDDEPVIRALVVRALTLAQFDVASAGNGKDALRLVAEGRVQPAVLVTDIDMPGMNGIELAARLLAMRPAIRVVMMTGDVDRAESARRHPSIVDAVLLKPMHLTELVDAVTAASGGTPAR